MKIKKFLQNIFKYFFQFLFKIIYGEIKYDKYALFKDNVYIKKIVSKKIINFKKKAYRVYRIPNGIIYTDTVENVAIIKNNKIIENISFQQVGGDLKNSKNNVTIYKGTPRFKKKISGNILSLVQGASGQRNYSHWLFDILPKIKLYSLIYPLKKIDYFYFDKLIKFQDETLKLINLDKIKIINSSKYRHVQADQVYATEHPWYNKGYVLDEAKKLPPWIIHWLRKTFLNKAKKFKINKKVFIDRSDSEKNHCNIINNKEVSSYLISKGFTSYKLSSLSFVNQVYLFANAKIIIGPHGAGLTNLTFCKPKTKIIEIRPIYNQNSVYKTISKINNLNYNLIKTPKVKNNTKGDILIDLNMLKKII